VPGKTQLSKAPSHSEITGNETTDEAAKKSLEQEIRQTRWDLDSNNIKERKKSILCPGSGQDIPEQHIYTS
jgi:hypothetical protein